MTESIDAAPRRTAFAEWAARDANLPALILLGGCLNGLAVRVIEEVGTNGFASLGLGLGPFQIIALVVAAKLVSAPSEAAAPVPTWANILALALILVPSSAIAWGAVALYAALCASRTSGSRRTGVLLFLALALVSLWSSVALKWLAAPVTTAEATLVGLVLGLVRPDIAQDGNVIGNPDSHVLVLMTACTTADALPMAALATLAVALFLGGIDRQRLGQAIAVLGLAYVAANTARLGAMAWSAEGYQLWHGPVGRNLFDGFEAILVLALGNWASRS
jgi:hypothetical protein